MNKPTRLAVLSFYLLGVFLSGCAKREAASPSGKNNVPERESANQLRDPIPELKALSPRQTDEIIKLVHAKIGSEFVGPDGQSLTGKHPLARTRLADLLRDAYRPGRGTRLPIQPNTRSGVMLPQQVSAILSENKKFDQLLASGDVPFLENSDSIFDSIYLFTLTILNGSVSAHGLTDQICEISERTPETALDMTLYFAISAGICEGGGGMRSDSFPLERLAALSQARNPIARILAIEALPRSLPDGETLPPSTEVQDTSAVDRARVTALMRFQGETDPLIIGRLIDSLGVLRPPEASHALEKIAEQQVQQKHDDLAKKAMGYLK